VITKFYRDNNIQYVALEVVQDHHPLKWWKENSHRLPLLSILAKKSALQHLYLLSGLSVLAGYIMNQRRGCLLPENVVFFNLKTSCNNAYRLCNLLSYRDNIDIVIIW